jgi:hypothetical protein
VPGHSTELRLTLTAWEAQSDAQVDMFLELQKPNGSAGGVARPGFHFESSKKV